MMTPDEMLSTLNDEGEDCGSDYHDGLDGYFGWKVRHGENQSTVLTARFYRVADEDDDTIVDEHEQRWLMIPVHENVEVAPPATRIEEPLDEDAVVLDADGDRWTRRRDRWYCTGQFPVDWPTLESDCGPLSLPLDEVVS